MKKIAIVKLGGNYSVVAKTTYPRENKAPDRKSKLVSMYCGIDKSAAQFVADSLKDTKVQVFVVGGREEGNGVIHIVKRYTDSHFAYNCINKDGKYKYGTFKRVHKADVQKYMDKYIDKAEV